MVSIHIYIHICDVNGGSTSTSTGSAGAGAGAVGIGVSAGGSTGGSTSGSGVVVVVVYYYCYYYSSCCYESLRQLICVCASAVRWNLSESSSSQWELCMSNVCLHLPTYSFQVSAIHILTTKPHQTIKGSYIRRSRWGLYIATFNKGLRSFKN